MTRKLFALSAVVFASLLLLPSISLAQKAFVRLYQDAVVQGTTLPKGEYRIELSEGKDQVTFLQGKKELAASKCRVETLAESVPGDIVVYGKGEAGKATILRIVLADEKITIHLEG